MNIKGLLGPQKAMARLQELQQKIDSFTPVSVGAPSFASALSGSMPVDPFQLNVTSSSQFSDMAKAAAERNGVDPKIFQALVTAESNWNTASTSKVGAMGLCQLMPGTAKGLGVTDPYDPAQSLEGGAKYLKQMLDRFGGNYTNALAAYNAGPGAVIKANGVPPFQETIAYVRKIKQLAGVSH